MKANLKINNFHTLRRRDPTGTLGLRRSFSADATRRHKALKRAIWQSVAINDVFALRERTLQTVLLTLQRDFGVTPLSPRAFEYERSDQKISRFMDWLNEQESRSTMQIIVDPTLPRGQEAWSDKYIQTAYRQGIADSRRDLIAAGVDIPSFDPTGLGLAGAFNQPVHADRVGLIFTRTFNALKGVDDEMDKQISRILAKGLAEGRNPNQLAREMNNRIDKIGITRSRLIARTEIVQTHNEATLNEYEVQSAILDEEILAEWNTAMDERVRSAHMARHEVVYKRDEALKLIGEPNCRCALIPYIESIHGSLEERFVKEQKVKVPKVKAPRAREPGFVPPTTPGEALDRLEAGGISGIGVDTSGKYAWKTDDLLFERAINPVVEEMERLGKAFPEVSKSLTKNPIKKLDINKGRYLPKKRGARGSYRPQTRSVLLAIEDAEVLVSPTLSIGGDTWAIGTEFRSNLRHEIGHHYFDFIIPKEKRNEFRDMWDSFGGKNYFKNNISEYAGASVNEAFSEAFNAYTSSLHSGNNVLPKEIREYFKEILGG